MWQRCLDNGDIYKLFGASFSQACQSLLFFLLLNLALGEQRPF